MAASDALSKQFLTLYRGLHNVKPEEIEQTNLGSHWSSSPEVASNFAYGSHSDYAEGDEPIDQGTVIEAKIHKRHIVPYESEEWQGWNEGEQVFGPESSEREHTVRPGAIVHVSNMWDVGVDKDWNNTVRQVKPTRRRGWKA